MNYFFNKKKLMFSSKKEKRKLPDVYQRLNYIGSTGTQYLDTGISLSDGYTFETDLAVTQYPTGTLFTVIGAGYRSSNRINAIDITKQGYLHYQYNSPVYSDGTTKLELNTKYSIKSIMKNGEQSISLNGIEEVSTATVGTALRTNQHFTVFARMYDGEIQAYSNIKLYGLKIYTDTEDVVDLVPCYRKSDGKPGMYDFVSGEFLVNQGTDEDFILGNTILENDNYQQVEYIGASGSQYIDTGYKIVNNSIKIHAEVSSNYVVQERDFIGNQDANTGTIGRFICGFYSNKIFAHSGDSTVTDTNCYTRSASVSNFYNIQIEYDFVNKIKTITQDGQTFSEVYNASIVSEKNVIIFGGGPPTVNKRLSGNIKIIRLIDGNLKLDLVPCYRKSDDEIGMYDVINNIFYDNDGTGEFTKGGNINENI